ncbi:MAG: hypothetical protein NTV38_10360, partial [Chloroflexi bacterium]|nr:hypothetical protein [Chloroflexota bacterium]
MVRDRNDNQYSKETKMNNSVLRSPVLWGFLILMFVSLWSANLVGAAPDTSLLQKLMPLQDSNFFLPLVEQYFPAPAPPLDHYVFLPLAEKNYTPPGPPPLDHYVFLPLMEKNYAAPTPLWRFGVAQVRRGLTNYDSFGIASMRFGWYVDYNVIANPSTPYGIEYVQTVRIKQDKLAVDGSTTNCRVGPYYVTPYAYTVWPSISQIISIAASHPGMTWLIGNEMDRVDYENSDGGCGRQDEMLPELYAQAYHDLYSAIKGADPTAQMAIGGMVGFTDLRRQYLDRVWAEYSRLANLYGWTYQTMPVDIWNIHSYVLQELKGSWGAGIPAGFSETSGVLYTILDNKDFSKAWEQIVSLR